MGREALGIRLGVITPMANEYDNARPFVQAVLNSCSPLVSSATIYVVLDNVSKDGTREILETYAQSESRLKVVWAPENRCVVDAYVRGYREALKDGCDWILEIDAGFSHDPAQIPRFLACIPEGWDCVFGTRFSKGGRNESESLKRKLVSWGGTRLSNLMLGTRLTDMTSGFELFHRDALQRVLDRGIVSRAHFFQTEIKAYCHGLRITEVPIVYKMPSPNLRGAAVSEAFTQLKRLRKLKKEGQLFLDPLPARGANE